MSVRDRAAKARLEVNTAKNALGRALYALDRLDEEIATTEQPAPEPRPAPAPSPSPAPMPTPTPAPAPGVPPVSVTLNGITYTLSAEDKVEGLGGTDRYEKPLTDGLWLVLHDTPRHGRADYIVERRNPAVYGPALAPATYPLTIADPRYLSQPAPMLVAEQGQSQRFRASSKPWPRGEVDRRYVFGVSPRCNPNGLPEPGEPTPMFAGGLQKAMGNTGLRADIGPYTAWLARAVRTGDFAPALRNAEAAASIPWHVRDPDGRIVMLSGPDNLSRQMETHYGTHSTASNTIRTFIDGWRTDPAHGPKSPWSGFVANSADPDPFVIEELQFTAAAVISQAAGSFTRSKTGLLITRDQVRDFAWGMVDLVHAYVATPETVPAWLLPRSAFWEIIDANLSLAHSLIGQPGFDRVSVALGKFNGAKTAGAISSQSNVADYIPLAMAHCFRMTGDVRFIELGRAHLDGRVAKRWRASPKYAALYPPVSMGTGTSFRFFETWEEAYRAKGWESTVDTPMGSWVRPTGTETDAAGKLLMPYLYDEMIPHTMLVAQLYRDLGHSTPDIEWLADYLEGQSAGAKFTMWEQFAVTL